MRRNWKKVLSLVLAASMALTMNTVAFADTTSDNATAVEAEEQEATETAEETVATAAEEAASTEETTETAEEVTADETSATTESTVASVSEVEDDDADEEVAEITATTTSGNETTKLTTLSGNFAKFLRKFTKTTVSDNKSVTESVEYNYSDTYIPGKATVSSMDLGITDGTKSLVLFYEYYDSNPWYDGRKRAWDGSYKKSNGKYKAAQTGTATSSKSVAADAALVWYDSASNTYTQVEGVRVSALKFKNALNATKDVSGNELSDLPKYKDSTLTLQLNINKKNASLANSDIRTIKRTLKNTKLDFGILRRSLAASKEQGSQGIYSSLTLKNSSFTIKNLQMRIRFKNSESSEDSGSNTYQDKTLTIKLPKKAGSTGASIAEKKNTYGAYCSEFSKADGYVTLVGVNNYEGTVTLLKDDQYGTFGTFTIVEE